MCDLTRSKRGEDDRYVTMKPKLQLLWNRISAELADAAKKMRDARLAPDFLSLHMYNIG